MARLIAVGKTTRCSSCHSRLKVSGINEALLKTTFFMLVCFFPTSWPMLVLGPACFAWLLFYFVRKSAKVMIVG
jgi:hypothetical protein